MKPKTVKRPFYFAIFYLPFGVFLIINVILLSLIFILRNIGNAIVWVNNHTSDYGDYFYDKTAKDSIFDEKMDEYIVRSNNLKKARKNAKNE